ncbi:MAG: endonuclease MutS2 [Chloroflexi bacterium]|nr:MAG: endonuclease MutS2 [Chloroflexota bacterium]
MITEKSITTLELHKILEQLTQYTSFSAGTDLAYELTPTVDLEEALTWQRETAEARELLEDHPQISLGGAHDVRDISLSAQRGVMIDASTLLDIRHTLRRGTTIKRTLSRLSHVYPLLAELVAEIEECSELQDAIVSAIDDNGEVKDSASPKLAIIRRDLKIAFDRLQTRLNRIITSPKAQFLQEAIITMRSGRYVIPLKAENKGKIPGVVHDSSSSGATLFIEPLETVELNNQWRELQLEEEKEVRRVLLELSALVGDEAERIIRTVEVLAYLDLTFAKARYANKLNAVQPVLVGFQPRKANADHPGSTIYLKGARHPLLKGDVVPIDIEFDDDTWVIVITGPNTGGKTVSLKTVGLLTLMAQCGLHLPVEEARLSVFSGVYADIGDEQSIEQSLSTFSAHLTNTITILDQCDSRSLVLLDELGAGTDPAEGSALARAILTTLKDRRVTTMVTTHHPELKIYSVETPGVRNASVEFDLETLAPTYRLIIGLPGRSNALAIANRLGLDPQIIEMARHMVATEDLVADDLLDEINRTRETIRREQEHISALRHQLEEQQAILQARLDQIEDERRNIINASRRHAEEELEAFRKELKRLRNEMRRVGMPLETVQALQAAAEKIAEYGIQKPIENITDTDTPTFEPRLGDVVWLETLNAEGTIIELDNNEAMVQVGSLRVRAKLRDLQKRTRSHKRQMKRGHVRQYEPVQAVKLPDVKSPGLELDLRGQRVEGAIERLEHYVDAAYTAGLPFARIIHGKGTGALRKAVREHVETHPLIAKVETAHPSEGGDGVTIIHMASMR